MTVFTFSEARQNFASVLEQARREGAIRIKRRDGQVFLVKPERSSRSPLDVPGVDADFSTDEIVQIVREMRERVTGLPTTKFPRQSTRKRTKVKDR
ncbi:MAG TPA: type II toxin-antitoxin system Phd/YefM family antitoxin [Candidatus Binataceae bacterium]|nr:type II toxin-antitoxin system Phd/YefM family antitoxin [Candidatus Binataceae bacterium]